MTNPMETTNVKSEPKEPAQTVDPKAKRSEKVRILRSGFNREERQAARTLSLRFSPYAWAKLLFFRDAGDTEIGGFGITPPDDLLYIMDFQTVKQQVSCVSVSFDDTAVADYFETQVDLGRKPEQFGRLWLHSHPGNCPTPSGTDEATFARVFGKCQWAVLAVVAREGKTYARLRFNVGPGGQVLVPMEVDYTKPFSAADPVAWVEEYKAHIHPEKWEHDPNPLFHEDVMGFADTHDGPTEALGEFDAEDEADFYGDPDNPWWWNY